MAASPYNALQAYPQLPLGVRLRDTATFGNYFAGVNAGIVRLLQETLRDDAEKIVYLWGGSGSGKTHLLQALCHAAAKQGQAVAYVPLRDASVLAPEVLDGLENLPLVVIDDIDAIAANVQWETAVFHLYNRIRELEGRLVMAGRYGPAALNIALADLRSRVAGALVLQLQLLSDAEKAAALRLQAEERGMEMPEEVALYLLRRCPRDMPGLFALLEVLDQASLAAQRKLTIPFVREILGLKV